MRRLHVEALDLAGLGKRGRAERTKRDAAERLTRRTGDDEAPARRSVGARQIRELAIETLEASVDLEPLRIFEKERADALDVLRHRRSQRGGRMRARHGAFSQPPTFASLPG